MTLAAALYNIILSPITQLIEISYRVFSKMFNNTGIAILGVSLTVTLLCLPLYIVAEKWQDTERDNQAKMKGGIERIKKFFKGDEQYMILSAYYRQNHYHPIMALRSSFGILIQIPFFLAAYHTLSALPELQGQSFLFIHDMGKPDSIFKIGSFAINILPILMTAINCVSGAIYSKGHGLREKVQIYGMAALFLVVLYNSPAGLVVYWTMNNILSLVKNIFYKMKNPLKVLYALMCAVFVFLAFYILVLYPGGANLKKRIPACIALLACIPLPLYIKAVNYIISNPLKILLQNQKLRFSLFIFSALALCFLTGLVLPASLMLSSVQEFSNIENYTSPTAFLSSSFWMSFGLIIFWPVCIYFLFKEKVQTLLSFAYIFILAAGIINSYIFAGSYGSMDSTLKFIDGFKNPSSVFMLLNVLVLALSAILLVFLLKLNLAKILSNVACICFVAFVIFTFINVSKISSQYKEFARIAKENSDDGSSIKYHLSKTDKNIVIFMLDRFESSFVPFILKDEPQLKEKLRGFVYYPNTISANSHTLMGSPGVYGGYEYTPWEMNKRTDKALKDKHNEALLLLPSILTKNSNFTAYLSDLSWANYSYISDMSFAHGLKNIHAFSVMSRYTGDFKKECMQSGFEKSSLSHILNRNLFWVSIFRQTPVALRPAVYYKGTWWENGVKESSSSFGDWFSALYYLPSVTSFDSTTPTLSIITNESTHSGEDISMFNFKNLPGVEVSDGLSFKNNNAYKINIVTLGAVCDFLDYIKKNNSFDNTKIIIVSDHGNGGNTSPELYDKDRIGNFKKDSLNCVLMVKEFNSKEEFKTDDSFMTNADVPSLALKDVIENPVNPFTGRAVSSEYKAKNGFYITTDDLFMPYHSRSKNAFTVAPDSWYNVRDNIFVDTNWEKVN